MIPDPIKKATDKKPAILLATLDAAILREREREKGNTAKEEAALSLDHIPVLLSQGEVELAKSVMKPRLCLILAAVAVTVVQSRQRLVRDRFKEKTMDWRESLNPKKKFYSLYQY